MYSGCKVPQIFPDTGLIQHVTGLRQFFFEVLIFHDSSSPKNKNSKEYKFTLRIRIISSKMTTQILKNIILILLTPTINLPVASVFYAVFLYHCHIVVESFDFFPGLQCQVKSHLHLFLVYLYCLAICSSHPCSELGNLLLVSSNFHS